MNALEFSDASDWESWLTVQHDNQAEAWLRISKQHSPVPLITIVEAGDSALCFGWIDGQRKACDELSFLQRFSRRRPRSPWSKVNVARVESLIAAGRVRPPVCPQNSRPRWQEPPWQLPPSIASVALTDISSSCRC